jgi:prevent-host-death family protein
MSAVGLRELKNHLSRYVQRARSGETVFITDRGDIVAELSPPRKTSATGEAITTLEEMRRKGLLHGGGFNDRSLYPALGRALKRSSASRLLNDERGDK